MAIAPKKEDKELWKRIPIYKFILMNLHIGILLVLFHVTALSQCPTGQQLYQKLLLIERDNNMPGSEKLTQVFGLQKAFDQCRLNKDSVYARLLHRIGVLEFLPENLMKPSAIRLPPYKSTLQEKRKATESLPSTAIITWGITTTT